MSTGVGMRAVAVSRPALLCVAAVALAGCTSINATNVTLEGTRWQILSIDGQPTPRTEMYRMSFEARRAGGRFGCNHFSGQYSAAGETLRIADTTSTLMGCPEPAASFEREGFAVLQQPMRMSWSSERQLILTSSAGSIALERLP